MAEEYILTQSVTLTIRTEDADRLLALGSGDAALLYLWLLRNGGRFDPARAAREVKTAGPLPAAMALLRQAGLIRPYPPRPPSGRSGRNTPPPRSWASRSGTRS